jgi:hypothetical protein
LPALGGVRDDSGMVRVLVAALVVVVGMATTAAADTESARLFEEGRALAQEEKWQEACAKFDQSLALDRAPGTLLNLAACQEELGQLALAWRLFDEAARVSEKEHNAERVKLARDRAQLLVPRTSTIVVKLATPDVPGLSVVIAGRTAAPAAEVREVVDPGDVVIAVSAPNMQPFTKQERAEAGLRIMVDVPPLVSVERAEPGSTTRRRHTRVLAAYTLGGLGAASIVTGVMLGISGKNKYDAEFDNGHCEDLPSGPRCNATGFANQKDAITRANIGTGFGVVGVLLVGAGAVVYLTAPKDVVVIPTATASSGGLAVVGRF